MHASVLALLSDTAKSIADNIQFGYGRTSDFNMDNDKAYPYIWLDPLTASATFATNNTSQYLKTWNCAMAFYQLDREDSTEKQYKLILDQMDEIVDKFINKLNQFSLEQELNNDLTTDQIFIQNINQQSFIKVTADILTGWLVNFQILTPDTFDYCSLYE